MKSRNLKTMALLLSLTVPAMALAQQGKTSPVQPLVIQPVQTFQPGVDGRLAYSNTDVTQLLGAYSSAIISQRKDDIEFLQNSVKSIVDQYNQIYSELIIKKLTKASQESRSNAPNGIPVNDFLAMDREYKAARETYLNKLAGIKAIPEGALPSAANLVLTENKSGDVPPWRKVDVSGIVNQFTAKLQGLDEMVNSLIFKVNDIMNLQQEVHGFNIDYTKLTLIRPEDRQKKQNEINHLKFVPPNITSTQDKFTALIVKDAHVYIEQFGEREQYRWRNDADMAAAKKTYDRVAEAFWARSWLRMKYGIGLGAFRMTYTKRWFGIEELMKSPNDFINFGDINPRNGEYLSARSETDLLNVAENIRQNANVADHRSTIGGSYSPLAIATYVWTLVNGKKAMMETANMVLKMIEADVNEELLVTSGNGQGKMKEYYKGRYYLTPEAKAKARELECAFDSETIEAVVQAQDSSFSCNNSGVGADAQGGFTRTAFQNIDNDLTGLQQNFETAAKLQAQLNAQTGNDKAKAKIRKGLQGL